jgi:hypothetical protein
VLGRGDDVRPLALWLPSEGRVNQNAHAVLQKLDAKPSGEKVVMFDEVVLEVVLGIVL